MAGANQNFFNIIYSYVDSKYFVQASAIKNAISGVFAFLISLLSGLILDVVQKNGNTVFGITIYGQQIQAIISFVFAIIAIIYIERIRLKKKK